MRDQPAGDAAGASEQGYKPYSDTGAHIEEAESKVIVQDSKIAPARESKGAEEAKDQVLRAGSCSARGCRGEQWARARMTDQLGNQWAVGQLGNQ